MSLINPENVTGWSELYDGEIVKAAFTLFDTAWGGWAIGILFLIFEMMLWMKTRDPVAVVMTSMLFISIYIAQVHSRIVGITLIVITILIAGILYSVIFKK